MRVRQAGLRRAAWALLVPVIAAVGLPVTPAAAAGPYKIMPLGDSITRGIPDDGNSYRVQLEDQLLGEGHLLDFVGSQSSGPAGLIDQDHESVNGATISDVAAGIEAELAAAAPDVVLLMIGTNDTKDTEWTDAATAQAELAGLVDQITAAAPDVTLVVSSIPPLQDATRRQRAADYNAGIPAIVDAADDDGDDVRFVDAAAELTVDHVRDEPGHLSTEGDTIVAGLFRAAITDVYPVIPVGLTIVAADDFDEADATGLGTADVGGTWSTTGTWGIAGNQAYATGSGESIATLDARSPDATVSATLTLSSTSPASPGLTLRALDADNQLLVGLTKRDSGRDDVRLYSVIAGTPVQLASADSFGLVYGHTYHVEADVAGDQVVVRVDGVEVLSHTLTGDALTALANATRHGLRTSLPTSETGGSRWDDFQIVAPPNAVPGVDAGAAQTVEPGSTVTLTGTAVDSDGTITTRAWAQGRGTGVVLTGADTATATFTAPAATASPQVLTFTFAATDDTGATAVDSTTVTVPAAPAAGREVAVRDSFNRTDGGLGTTDTGQPWQVLSATWAVDGGEGAATAGAGDGVAVVEAGSADAHVSSVITLSPTGPASPGFALRVGDLNNHLLVGAVRRSGHDRVSLFKVQSGATTLLDQRTGMGLQPGETYALEARMDGADIEIWWEGTLLFSYTLTEAELALYGANTLHGLRTSLGTGDDTGSRWDELLVTVATDTPPVNVAPVADAGDDQTVAGGATVTLDGSGSTDSDGSITGYAWAQTAGTAVALGGGTTAGPTFTAPAATGAAQTLTFRLTVTDDDGATSTDDVTVTIAATTPPCDPATVGDAGFTDVPAANVHADAIDCIAFYDITTGETTTTYVPGGQVTRAQMASFVARTLEAAGVTLPAGTPVFTDVAGNAHESRINQLAAAGLVQGVGGGRYDPQALVTRAQIATFIVGAHELAAGEPMRTAAHPFTDVAGDVHEPAIAKVAAAGITTGVTATTYEPGAAVRRDQMASFLARTLESLAAGGHLGA